MKTNQTAHIDELVRVAEGAPSERDTVIQNSWRRCVTDHKLDPSSPQEAFILPSEQLRPHREAMEAFLHTARYGLEALYRKVAGLGYVLLLTDAKGVTVDFIGDRALDNHLRSAGLYLGADWNEDRAGTSGVGTCIVTGEGLTVHQTDHFDATHIPLTCTSAPIFDCSGELAAVLDISALRSPPSKDSQSLALELVKGYAHRIENANLMNRFRREWILKLSASPEFADVDPDYILALDSSGRIVGFNHMAQVRMAQEAGRDWRDISLIGQSVCDLFECDLNILPTLVHSRPAEQRAIHLKHSQWALFAQAMVPPAGVPVRSSDAGETSIPEPLRSVAGCDPAMRCLLSRAAKLVNTRMSLLIQGETGTGKEYFAKALHRASVRAGRPFVAVNCAALPESLIESELFGYEAGSFTGAGSKGKHGLILEADGGTLFLDEIGDMPLDAQTRLLRVLAEYEVTPIGRTKPIPVDVRVIAATHRDLTERVNMGQFRDDLYYRLSAAVLTIPPLRQRADLNWLIERLLKERNLRDGTQYFLTEPARAALCGHSWPGNIRELINCLEYASAVSAESIIRVSDLPEHMKQPGTSAPRPGTAAPSLPPEAEQLRAALERHHWNIPAVARELKVHRSTVYRQIQQFDIRCP
jgi:transcriptional regulator of acetoin/glycerol metabolism